MIISDPCIGAEGCDLLWMPNCKWRNRIIRVKQIMQGHKGDVGHVESNEDSFLLWIPSHSTILTWCEIVQGD